MGFPPVPDPPVQPQGTPLRLTQPTVQQSAAPQYTPVRPPNVRTCSEAALHDTQSLTHTLGTVNCMHSSSLTFVDLLASIVTSQKGIAVRQFWCVIGLPVCQACRSLQILNISTVVRRLHACHLETCVSTVRLSCCSLRCLLGCRDTLSPLPAPRPHLPPLTVGHQWKMVGSHHTHLTA